MIYYIVLFSSYFLAYVSAQSHLDQSKKYLQYSIGLLVIFSGLRVDAGYDYGSYVQLIEGEFYENTFELLPRIFAYIAYHLDFIQLFFILSSATLGLSIFLLIKKEDSRAIFILFYFSLPFCFIDSFSLVRQYLAMSCFLLAYALFVAKGYKSALALLLMALVSHHTAYIAAAIIVPCVIFNNQFLKYWRLLVAVIPLIIFLAVPLALVQSSFYQYVVDSNFFGAKGFLIWTAVYLPTLFFIREYTQKYSDPILILGLVGFCLYISLIPYGYFGARFFVYFAPFCLLFAARILFIKKTLFLGLAYIVVSSLSLFGYLYGASQNLEFDFLNNYKIAPSSCDNCNIRGMSID
jgi:hypothetical protein